MSVNARRFLEARSKSIEFKKGELVAEPGRSFDSAYIVAKGAVSFYRSEEELHNSEIPPIVTLKKGSFWRCCPTC